MWILLYVLVILFFWFSEEAEYGEGKWIKKEKIEVQERKNGRKKEYNHSENEIVTQTWDLSKNLHDPMFRPEVLHTKSA